MFYTYYKLANLTAIYATRLNGPLFQWQSVCKTEDHEMMMMTLMIVLEASDQCDQFGRFLKVLWNKVAQIFSNI